MFFIVAVNEFIYCYFVLFDIELMAMQCTSVNIYVTNKIRFVITDA